MEARGTPAVALAADRGALCSRQGENERMLEQDLDILDGLVAAEIQAETAKHFEGPQADPKQMQLEETGGIPTGVAPDIHRQVELRKAKRAAAPDNLA
jgi:hypothetical protein